MRLVGLLVRTPVLLPVFALGTAAFLLQLLLTGCEDLRHALTAVDASRGE